MVKIPGMNLLMMVAAFALGAVAMFFYTDLQEQAKVIEEQAAKAAATPIPQRAGFYNSDSPPPERATVERVFDGLTIGLDSGQVVRYLGVRVPEAGGEVHCFGKEALQANESMVGKEVRLETDPVLERAQDGAWTRYVWVDEGDDQPHKDLPSVVTQGPEGEFVDEEIEGASPAVSTDDEDSEEEIKEYLVNERIIELGLGFPLLSEEMEYYDKMLAAARFASATKRGMWGQCKIEPDEEQFLQTAVIEECVIKGVKLVNGQKAYREPGCRGYEKTIVLTTEGEKWFCSVEEAGRAGFVRAEDCD